jgi:hypothetical protein
MLAEVGVTAIEFRTRTAVTTVIVAVPLMPLKAAVMVLEPAATAVAIPEELIVATALFAEVQVAVVLTFPVEPSLYVAVAVNCWVAPGVMLPEDDETPIDVSVFGGGAVTVEVPPHPAIARINGMERERNNT